MSLARGTDAMLRSLEQLQQAIEPLYASLFIPFSNQPNGMLSVCYNMPVRQPVCACQQ